MIDLHVHSTASDGSLTPAELVDYAVEKNLSAFALTDHDTIDGIESALLRADEWKKKGIIIEVIPGIELSTEYKGKDIHIVGLFIDYHKKFFQEYLADFVASREERNVKMCKNLENAGLPISYEKLLCAYPGSVITRAHYAGYLYEQGFVSSRKEAFERYLGDDTPYFVPRKKVAPQQAVDLIKKSGGIPILAHPILYKLEKNALDELVCVLKNAGLVGMEAIYSTYTPADERLIRTLSQKYDLQISGGSDFHGSAKPSIDLGTGRGNLFVHDEILANLRNKL